VEPTTIYAFAALLIVLAAGMIYSLIGKNEKIGPEGLLQWLGSLIGVSIIGAGLWLVAITWKADVAISSATAGRTATSTEIEEMDLAVPAEDFAFREVATAAGHSLSQYRGKVVLLNLWATWCPPCLSEIPELNRLHTTYADEGLVVISVSDEPVDELRAFERNLRLETVSMFVSPTDELPDLVKAGFEIRPTSYIIDRDGTVRKYILGARSFRHFERLVRPFL
jgi:thiol-disulfide isomerase/thioredoxin